MRLERDASSTPRGAHASGRRARRKRGRNDPRRGAGGITELPAGYEPGDWHPDPFAGDEPLFTITAENAKEHAEHLSDGQRALLAAYPETWRMNDLPDPALGLLPRLGL